MLSRSATSCSSIRWSGSDSGNSLIRGPGSQKNNMRAGIALTWGVKSVSPQVNSLRARSGFYRREVEFGEEDTIGDTLLAAADAAVGGGRERRGGS